MTTSNSRSSHSVSLLDGEIVEESNLGSMRRVTADSLPILKGLSIKRVLLDISMYSLRATEDGMREPHWHPVTAEMDYVQHGDARMTIMSPDGTLDTRNLTTGDMYFIPRAYPHHIENIGTHDWHFLIFFDQPFPADIGYRASASAYSREVLAAAFNTHIDDLPNFPFTPADPLVVGRLNPVDAHGVGQA